MKKLYILLLFMVCAGYAQQQPFITTWEVQGDDLSIRIPVYGNNNNYTVDFGDGTILNNQSGLTIHQFTEPGIYTVTMSGNIPGIKIGTGFNPSKLKTIEQWGDNVWNNMSEAFPYCLNLRINAIDAPDLSQVTNMDHMFSSCHALNDSINHWDVSNVTNMEGMFAMAIEFNQPLNNWDVSNVTNMKGMFSGCDIFNQNLNNWDVSNVINMEAMFAYTDLFNQPLNNWNVSNVSNMRQLFYESQVFNQPLDNWNVSNVNNMDQIFLNAKKFNGEIGTWDVTGITNMDSMFLGCSDFNKSINNWDVSNVNNMYSMFYSAPVFNQPLDNWNVSNVTNMGYMFNQCTNFNQPLNNWDVSNVINMFYMFAVTDSFNQPLNNWNVSNVNLMNYMFFDTDSFNQPLDNWNVSNVMYMDSMFYGSDNFNQDISAWDYSSVQSLGAFLNNTSTSIQNYDALLNRFVQLGMENFTIVSNGLHYCDTGVRNYLIDNLNWNIQGDSLGEECEGNTVAGTILIDENQNGCEATDTPAVNFMVQATNGTYNYGIFVNADGAYDLRVQEDTYTVAPVNVPSYFTVTPTSAEVTFTGFGNSEALNFCLVPNQSVQDLNITVLPIGDARPGFESDYKILVENIGTQSVSNATVSLTFDNTLQSFVSAAPAPATTAASQLTFTLTDLGVFETKEINLTMTTFVPPIVNGGEAAVFTATVTPDTGDNTPDDNTFVLNQTIVNSFDPNDKRVVQGDEIFMEQTDEYLDYIIRFQNTGTASAITVRVDDVLSEKLDWTTLKPTAASHAYRVEVTEGNKVSFIFDSINLPHEAANAEGSNGYIAYKIKPISTIQLGDVMGSEANIYFDFNLPIVTNIATTTVVPPLGVTEHIANNVTIYPNPASTVVHIQPKANTQLQEVKIYNLQGRELMNISQQMESIDVSPLSTGVYMLLVKTNAGLAKYKLVKK